MAEVTSVSVSPEDVANPTEETPAVVTQETTKVETPAPETPAGEQKAPDGKPAEQTPVSTDVDLDQAATEFIEKGEISEASLKALEAKGFSKAQISTYAAGIQAQAAQAVNKLAERVGGVDQFNAIREWAKNGGLNEADGAAYNAMMSSGNEFQMTLALDGLAARYERATGTMPERVNGTAQPTSNAPKGFESRSEVTAAMRDPRYSKDPAYRAAVTARLAASDDNLIAFSY